MITNHQKYNQIIKSLDYKPRLLLHSCCAPCSTVCLERLTEYFNVDIFYYNPNITCEGEFLKRLSEQKRYCLEVYGERVKVIETSHRLNDFYAVISGLENLPERSKRCYNCYELRLKETANYAKVNGYDYFATTLTVSPHKNEKWLNEIGERLEKELSVKYLPTDFKKEGGYLRSIELSKEYDLYRQDFCGCQFSKK